MRSLPLLFVLLGCGDGGIGDGDGSATLDYFPLAVGARWEYENADGTGGSGPLVKEITRCADIAFVDCSSGDDREESTYVQEKLGCGARREGCDGACVSLGSDPTNCGACGTTCAAGEICLDGLCSATACVAPRQDCDGACVDFSTDAAHCGACGSSCGDGQACVGGACEDDGGLTYLAVVSDGIVRVKQDIYEGSTLDHYVTYSPFFVRLFAPPYGEGREETYTHERCEYDATGISRSQDNRTYRHRVVGEQEVTVPAGTYQTVVTERIDLVDSSTKRYYWARGVGKVLEEEILAGDVVGATESLVEFTAGDGSCD